MKTLKKISFCSALFLFTCSLLFIYEPVNAQSRIIIENAGRAEGGIVDGEAVRKLIDNVVLRTEDMLMEADSAYQFIDQNKLHAFNIQIETEKETIWADTLYHNTVTEFSEFIGRVIIESPTNTVFSSQIDLIAPLDLIIFKTPVRFEDERGTLLANRGFYYQDIDSAGFYGDVQLADSTQYLESDSLFMNRNDDLYELFSRVYADDFEDDVKFAGDYLYADSLGYRLLTGDDAWMMEVNEAKTDTTHLLAKKIELMETDTVSYMDAFTQVRIWSTKFAAIADTANYRDDTDQFILRSSPILWQKNTQLTGPIIEATFENDDIKFLRSYTRPISVQEDSLTGRLNQMTGDTLHAYFDEGELQRIVVFDNSEIIFHLKDDNDEPDGLMEMVASGSSTMIFTDGEFDFFKAEQNIDGSHLPEDPENIDRQLENFRWDPELKPQRPPIQQPRLPDIPEERPFELPPRYIKFLELREQETPEL